MKKPEQVQKSATSAVKSLGTAKLETVEGSGQTKQNRDTTIVYKYLQEKIMNHIFLKKRTPRVASSPVGKS